MDQEERNAAQARAKAESLEALQRTAHVRVERRAYRGEWQRSEPVFYGAKQSGMTDAVEARLMTEIDKRIAAAVDAVLVEIRMLGDARMKAVGIAVSEVRAKMREEIAAEVGSLRADLTVERAHGDGKIIDLPALPMRKV